MRVPLSWLRDHVDIDLTPRELADALTMRGMEVSGIETVGADWTDVVVGRLLEVERHPNADTLWLTKVDVGPAGGELAIVCGAQNLEVGQLVPAALVGATLPGDRRIERTKIRGVVSEGMLCSADELGLGSDADGIHILGRGADLELGRPLADLVGETVLDVDVKPNRGDALSIVGLAREIAAFTGHELRIPEPGVADDGPSGGEGVTVRIDEPELNPRFTALRFEGVRNGPSPEWMQRRLVAAGMRPISAVVDVTNYVMHELGQPQHAYDADAIPDGQIVVRRARAGETIETIDHAERRLDDTMLVIADRERPIGLAGIMGGSSTEVTESTTAVILESAVFHGPTIRNTARRLALRSEASMRHEKGIGPDLPRLAARRAAELLLETTGARVVGGIVDNDPGPHPPRSIDVDVERVVRLLGIDVDATAVRSLLEPLGFGVDATDARARVTVPLHRQDVVLEADVAEEVARAYGYDRVEGRLPRASLPAYRPDPSEPRHRIRRVLAGLGLDEIVSHALIGEDDLARTGYDGATDELVRLFNPLSQDHAILRPVLYPSLLAGAAENARRRRPAVWLFELGKVYWHARSAPGAREGTAETAGTGRFERWEVGIVLAGAGVPPAPDAPARDADVGTVKGIVDALHDALGAPRPSYRADDVPDRHPHRHPGRNGLICDADGRAYGSLGEIHPRVVEAWNLVGRPVDAVIDVGRLLRLVPDRVESRPVSAAQPVDRDLAIVVDATTPVGDVLRIARSSGGPLLEELRLFDIYRGGQIGDGRVSYALAMRFGPAEASNDGAVDRAMNKIRGALRHHLGADIR